MTYFNLPIAPVLNLVAYALSKKDYHKKTTTQMLNNLETYCLIS